jgi:hypothetical protein
MRDLQDSHLHQWKNLRVRVPRKDAHTHISEWGCHGKTHTRISLMVIMLIRRGGARNFLRGGLSPPNSNFNPDTKKFFTCFRKFSGWAQHPFGWAEPTPAHPWRRHYLYAYYVRYGQLVEIRFLEISHL